MIDISEDSKATFPNDKKLHQKPSELRKEITRYKESRDEWKQRVANKRKQVQTLMTDKSRLKERLQNEKFALKEANKIR